MPIRTSRIDKGSMSTQHVDISDIVLIARRYTMASYTDRKSNRRIRSI